MTLGRKNVRKTEGKLPSVAQGEYYTHYGLGASLAHRRWNWGLAHHLGLTAGLGRLLRSASRGLLPRRLSSSHRPPCVCCTARPPGSLGSDPDAARPQARTLQRTKASSSLSFLSKLSILVGACKAQYCNLDSPEGLQNLFIVFLGNTVPNTILCSWCQDPGSLN